MLSMVTFVVIYANYESKEMTKRQIEHFVSTTVTMEHVTENYLQGEQRVCDVWTHYINDDEDITLDEAISFIRHSHAIDSASAHIVFVDTLEGASTRLNKVTGDYTVSYRNVGLLNDISWIKEKSINVSHAYTNPTNAEQSIAFCNIVHIKDEGVSKEAILLRVMPISELKGKWIFPHEEFVNAELSIIDSNGEYIIKGYSFKNGDFFDFYRYYNGKNVSAADLQKTFKEN